MSFKTVKRRKVYEDVTEQIEDAIVNGQLKVGDLMPSERELMAQFGVGRPAVREALLQLERSGFLELGAGGRAKVREPAFSSMLDQLSSSVRHFLSTREGERNLQNARRVFESAIAREAAMVATDAEIQLVANALEANTNAVSDPAIFEQTDVMFHRSIAEAAKNPVFVALHSSISEWLSYQRNRALRVEGIAELAVEGHIEVFEAIAKREPEEAGDAMSRHIEKMNLAIGDSGK